jgi:hypothetical protein
MTSWIPDVEACTLPAIERPERAGELSDLLAASTVERVAATHLRLGLEPTPDVAARVASLAVREAACCLFFTFTLTADRDGLRLDVTVSPEHSGVLDAMAASKES